MPLHLHRSESSALPPDGPVYAVPGDSRLIVNEPSLQADIKYAVTTHALWPRELEV
jgi:hypothetical protein